MSWSPSNKLSRALVALALVLHVAAARAQQPHEHHAPATIAPAGGMSGGCESFKWPLDKERAAFEAAALDKVVSGTARGPLREEAFTLTLLPGADVAYTLAPAKKKIEGFGGIVAFAAPEKPGVYQVTLSGEGWIDLVQDGSALHAADHTGAKKCPGLRKSVRFQVGEAPVVLQINGAAAEGIKVAIRPVD
jgi:hypothetical protein